MGASDRLARGFARIVGIGYRMRMGRSLYHQLSLAHRCDDRLFVSRRHVVLPHRRNARGNYTRIFNCRGTRLRDRARALVERYAAKGSRTVYCRSERPSENRTRPPHHHMVRYGKQSHRIYDRSCRADRRRHAYVERVHRHRFE